MKTVEEVQRAPDRHRVHERGFKAARRRRTILSIVSVVVVMVVCVVALAIVEVATPMRMVDAAIDALPQGELSAEDVQAAATGLQHALDDSPGNDYVVDATTMLQQRVARQVDLHIERGELDRADTILTAANGSWSGSELFGDTGELRSALVSALQERQNREEVSELIVAVQKALAIGSMGVESIEGIGAMLRQLHQALDLDPGNESAQTLRGDIRRDLIAEARRELDAGNPDRAQELLDVAQNEWRGDDDIARMREELIRFLDELAATAELQRLIALGEQRLDDDNLTTPTGDSAADYFREALALDPGNGQARAGLARVAGRYAVLIRAAVERGDTEEARRLLAKLIEVAPQHPEIGTLRAAIEEAEEITVPPEQGSVIADDEEGRLWSEVMNSCDVSQLRRYINDYPAGRYIDEAWDRRTACLESR